MVDKKRGSSRKNLIDLVFIFSLAIGLMLMLGVINAQITSVFNSGRINYTNYSIINLGQPVNEDVAHVYNITINHTLGYGFKVTNVTFRFLEGNFTLNTYLGDPINAAVDNMTIGVNGITDQFSFVQVVNASPDYIIWNASNSSSYVFAENNSRAVNVSWFFFNATADTPGDYNLTIIVGYLAGSDVGNLTHYEHNVTIHINDTTVPMSRASTFSEANGLNRSVTNNAVGNYSGYLLLNISLSDNGGAIRSVFFNISYNENLSTNGSHWWYQATNSSTSPDWWYYNLDTTQLPDGFYNVSVIVNDTNGNVNSTTHINLTIDNTPPEGEITCSPVDAYVSGTVTCTCTSEDGLSGISSSGNVYTTNPSTEHAEAGLTQTCTFKDTAGNQGSAVSNTYNVWGSPDGAGPSGGPSGTPFIYSKTIPETNQDFSELNKIETSSFSGGGLGAKEKVTFKLNEEEHYLGIRALTVSSATIEIASTPVQINLNIGDGIKRDLDGDGFYDLYVKLNNIINGKADLTMQYIHEEISASAGEETQTGEEEIGEQQPEGTQQMPLWVWGIIIAALILIILVTIVLLKKKRK